MGFLQHWKALHLLLFKSWRILPTSLIFSLLSLPRFRVVYDLLFPDFSSFLFALVVEINVGDDSIYHFSAVIPVFFTHEQNLVIMKHLHRFHSSITDDIAVSHQNAVSSIQNNETGAHVLCKSLRRFSESTTIQKIQICWRYPVFFQNGFTRSTARLL